MYSADAVCRCNYLLYPPIYSLVFEKLIICMIVKFHNSDLYFTFITSFMKFVFLKLAMLPSTWEIAFILLSAHIVILVVLYSMLLFPGWYLKYKIPFTDHSYFTHTLAGMVGWCNGPG